MNKTDRDHVLRIAHQNGYALEQEQDNIKLLIFVRNDVQVNVYYSKMTVGTALHHPKRGATQLFRRCVSLNELERIFKNPRIHTGKGYYRR